MKLFKISFISIISILIFQSQLYGINLRCDFKRKLEVSNFDNLDVIKFNGISCGSSIINLCTDITQSSNVDFRWISKVIIKNKVLEEKKLNKKIEKYLLKNFPKTIFKNLT